jgi:transcriptional regulator with XRE-family HTH domain
MDDEILNPPAQAPPSQILSLLDEFKDSVGITHAEVARRIGISRQNLDLWRRRGIRTMPSCEVLEGIARAIDRDYVTVLTAALSDVGYLRTEHAVAAPPSAEAMEMGTYAAAIIGSRHDRRAFCNPVTHMKTRGPTEPYFTLWRAELHLTDADNPASTVVAGYADFIRAKLGAPVADLLSQLPSDHGDSCDPHNFAALFDPGNGDFSAPIEQVFEPLAGVFGAAILIENVFIDPAFRGFNLGPWLVADVVHRLTEDINDMVAMIPHVCARVYADPFFDEGTRIRESHPLYWRDILHLEDVVVDGTLMLVQATGFTALSEARDELASEIDGQLFPIDVAELLDRHAHGHALLWPLSGWHPAQTPASVVFEQRRARALETAMAEGFAGVASEQVDGLKHVLASVRADDQAAVQTRLAAVVTFLGQEDSEAQDSGPFALAAFYLAEHPEFAVAGVQWQSFEDDNGSIMYRLDVEVVPPAGRSPLFA